MSERDDGGVWPFKTALSDRDAMLFGLFGWPVLQLLALTRPYKGEYGAAAKWYVLGSMGALFWMLFLTASGVLLGSAVPEGGVVP
jgi:hypothetical protein